MPRYVAYTSREPSGAIFATKPAPGAPPVVGWKLPAVVGNCVVAATPVMYAAPAASTAIASGVMEPSLAWANAPA